jgi:hypothetical protein
MKKVLQLTFLLALSLGLRAQTEVSFSFQAHQDDWQLFMSSKIVSDLNSGGKVVFVTLTAGDASCGSCTYGSTIPFYIGRETGSVRSAKFAADLAGGIPGAKPDSSRVTVNGHSIVKYVYQNTVNYFLRLPDGNGDGSGFPNTGNKSLQKLKQGTISSISSVDGMTTYTSWLDLTNTLKEIINTERGLDPQVWLSTASLDAVANPGDHSDHTYSSTAAQDAVSGLLWVGIYEFVDYYSSALPANLNNSDHENAVAIFAVDDWGLLENTYLAPFDDAHKGWLPMDYFSVKRVPVGTASFAIITPAQKNDPFLTKIPMVVSVTSPALVTKDISMIISPFEKGQLTTSVYDMSGNLVYKMDTEVKDKKALLITLKNAVKESGNYIVKNILNEKYIESKTIIVK